MIRQKQAGRPSEHGIERRLVSITLYYYESDYRRGGAWFTPTPSPGFTFKLDLHKQKDTRQRTYYYWHIDTVHCDSPLPLLSEMVQAKLNLAIRQQVLAEHGLHIVPVNVMARLVD